LLTVASTSSFMQGSDRQMTYTVARQSAARLQRMPASEGSALEPGDLPQVTPVRADLAAAHKPLQN